MKFYLTIEDIIKLKRSFLNLKLYSIIDVSEILDEYGYSYTNIDEYGIFLVNKEIMSKITTYLKSKRIRGIIYINKNLNEAIIDNLFDELEEYERIQDIVLLDDYNIPRLKEYWDKFKEVVFFPSIKKIRLTEYQNISDENLVWQK